jgi:hypothetical protein
VAQDFLISKEIRVLSDFQKLAELGRTKPCAGFCLRQDFSGFERCDEQLDLRAVTLEFFDRSLRRFAGGDDCLDPFVKPVDDSRALGITAIAAPAPAEARLGLLPSP